MVGSVRRASSRDRVSLDAISTGAGNSDGCQPVDNAILQSIELMSSRGRGNGPGHSRLPGKTLAAHPRCRWERSGRRAGGNAFRGVPGVQDCSARVPQND